MYVPPEVYVPPHDSHMLADITAIHVKEFNLFLHYKPEKHARILMEMTVQMYSSSLVALHKTYVNFLYIFANVSGFPNKSDKNHDFVFQCTF